MYRDPINAVAIDEAYNATSKSTDSYLMKIVTQFAISAKIIKRIMAEIMVKRKIFFRRVASFPIA